MYDVYMTAIPHRITVNLTERAVTAMDLAAAINGDSKTDTVNRALQVYAYLAYCVDLGDELYLRDHESGETSKLMFL